MGGFIEKAWDFYGIGGVLAILVYVVAGVSIYLLYKYSPLVGERALRDRIFWHSLSENDRGIKGVLYSDDRIFCGFQQFKGYFIRRFMVVLKYADPSKDRVFFRSEETPNRNDFDDTIQAFSCWIKAARKHNVPAVYRSGRPLYMLSEKQINEIEDDPILFAKRFIAHIEKCKSVPLPEVT